MALAPKTNRWRPPGLRSLALLAVADLACGWLLVSTAGENNDLGWRAILRAILVLTIVAAAATAYWATVRPRIAGLAVASSVALSLPDTSLVAVDNLVGHAAPSAMAFAETPALWEAVRRHASPGQRIANNPRLMVDMTPWVVNISWALLCDRRSCFAGHEMALAFAFLSDARRQAISSQFVGIFAGTGSPSDLDDLADVYGCDVVVLTPADGAWLRIPSPLVNATAFWRCSKVDGASTGEIQ